MDLINKLIIIIATANCILGPIDAYLSYMETPIDWIMVTFCIAAVIFSIWSIGWTYKKSTLKVIDDVK